MNCLNQDCIRAPWLLMVGLLPLAKFHRPVPESSSAASLLSVSAIALPGVITLPQRRDEYGYR